MNKKLSHVIPAKGGIPSKHKRFRIKFEMMVAMIILLSLNLSAQEPVQIDMADEMRASGKIYVVVTVLSIVFIGIVIYLINLDRKISKLEKEIEKK